MSGKRPVIQCLPVAPVPITRVLYSGRRRPTRLGTRLDLDSDSKQRHRAIRLTRCTMSDLFCASSAPGQAATRKQSPYFTRWLRMRSLSSLSVQSARCSRTAHATRASISAAGAPPQRWNDVPRGTMRLPRASKINPVRRDPVSSRDLRRAPRLAASRACKDHTDAVGLVGIGHQFAILNVIAQWDRAAHPHALAARCRKFVAATVTLCWRRKASHFWGILLLVCGTAEHG